MLIWEKYVTALKATNLAEEHNVNIHPCESIHSSGKNSATLFTFQSLTTSDVQRIFTSVPPNKASFCDEVNAKILNDSSAVIAPIITGVINNSFSLSSLTLTYVNSTLTQIRKKP